MMLEFALKSKKVKQGCTSWTHDKEIKGKT